ncbi:MAG: phytoene/squalene synthase family protein, partial [Polyangiales bacterium]
ARASDLGVAMQLSNIARDVGEDARRGRLYLPTRWLDEAGVQGLAGDYAPHFSPALHQVVGRVVAHADALYARASAGIGLLPLRCRPAIAAALRIYRAIGHRLLAQGGNSIDQRVHTSRRTKLACATLALVDVAGGRPSARTNLPCLPAAEFLVQGSLAATAATPIGA